MRIGCIHILSGLIFSLIGVTSTWAVSLDFESGCGSRPAPAGCKDIISRPGFSNEVIFSQSSSGTNIVSQVGTPALPFTPSRSARWDTDQPLPDDPFRADFTISGVNMVSVVLGDNGQDSDELFINAFDKVGNHIGSDSRTLLANIRGGFALSVSTSEIAAVEFGRRIEQEGEGNSILFDNFTYTTMNATIPEPSTLLMIGTGLLGISFWRNRQIKKLIKKR